VQVEQEKFLDASEPDDQNMHDYCYSGTNEFFREESRGLHARIDDETQATANSSGIG
jgi:hypothetical protein